MRSRSIERLKACLKDSRRKKYFLFILTFVILFFLNHKYIAQNLNLPQWLVIEIETEKPIQIQIYYDIGERYNERDKRIQKVSGGNDFQQVRIRLPGNFIHSFRVDPLTTPGIVYIKSITLESLFGRNYKWPAWKILKDFHPQNDIRQFILEGDLLKVESIGIDPYFSSTVPIPVVNRIHQGWMILFLFSFSWLCLGCYKWALFAIGYWKKKDYPLSLFKWGFYAIGISLPVMLAILFVHRNGLNVPLYDQWEFVPLWSDFLDGKPWSHHLFASHNEHRMIFPKLIFLATAKITQWDVTAEMYINLFFITLVLFMVILLLKRTEMSLLLSVPIAWILFSLNQYENLLWGWQMAIFIMTSGVVASILFLDQVRRHAAFIIAGILSATVASFSFLSGLIIWPVGFLQLILMRQKISILMAWLISGCFVVGLYVSGSFSYADASFRPDYFTFLKIPFEYVKYISSYIGSIVGGGHLKQSVIYGSIILFLFITLNLIQLFHAERENNLPWIMMGIFSLGSGMMTGVGRLTLGSDQALESRYVSISLFFTIATLIGTIHFIKRVIQKKGYFQKSLRILFLILSMMLIIGYIESYIYGWREGYQGRLVLEQFSRSLYDLSNAHDREVKMIYWDPDILRERAHLLRDLKTGPYAPKNKAPGE